MERIVVLDLDNVLVINRFDNVSIRRFFRKGMRPLLLLYELAEFLLCWVYVPELKVNKTIQRLIKHFQNDSELILLTDRSGLGLFNIVRRGLPLNVFDIVYIRKSFLNVIFLKKLGLEKDRIWQHRRIKPHISMINAISIHAKNLGIESNKILYIDDSLLMTNLARTKDFQIYTPYPLN